MADVLNSSLILQEVSDLQEQLADLMRHLETQEAISSAPDETRQVGKRYLFFPLQWNLPLRRPRCLYNTETLPS